MPNQHSATVEKSGSDRVTQFSIFLPNKVGAFLNIVKLLNEHHIHVLATNKGDWFSEQVKVNVGILHCRLSREAA